MQIELLERFHLNFKTEGFVLRTKVLKKTTTMTHSKSKKKNVKVAEHSLILCGTF